MKLLHVAVGAAVLLVLALVAYMATTDGGRGGARRADVRDDPARATEAAPDPGESDAAAPGALAITLAIVLPDDQPADGAEVEIDRGLDPVRARADGLGRLSVRGLAPGLYDLRARKGRHSGAMRFAIARTTDLGTLRLAAAVRIAGRVFGARGEPVAGARVEACRGAERGLDMMAMIRGVAEPEEVVACATSAEDGRYELLVPAGTLSLRATARGHAQGSEPPRPYVLDTEGADLWLAPGALLEGRVLGPGQDPVAAARVLVIDPMSLFGTGAPKSETATAADGTFSMIVSPTEQSMLVVRAIGYATYMQGNLHLPQSNAVIVLEEGIALRLQAVDAERPEVPAPQVNVIAIYKGGFATGRTDDMGRLSIENLPTRNAGMGGDQRLFLWGGGFIAQEVAIGPKEPVDGVLDMGVVKVAPGGVVRGKVLDKASGEPVEGARVRSVGGLDPQLEIFGSVAAVSARDGSFRLTGVPLAAVTLLAVHPEYASSVDPMSIMRLGAAGPALFPEGSRDVERNVELVPAERVTGTVLAPDGTPVAGATVEPTGDETRMITIMLGIAAATTTSDEKGAFVLKGVQPGAELEISASHRDYGPSETAKARAGEPVTLRLSEPIALKGVVVDDKGAPIAGVRVLANRASVPRGPSEFRTTRPSVTDEEGRYLVRNAPKGELAVSFEHPDYAPTTVQTSSQDVGRTVLARGGTIAGEAVDDAGQPVAGISVHAWSQEGGGGTGRRNSTAVTDDKGRFAMHGLADGEFQLRTWDQSRYAKEQKVRTGTTDARIVLLAAAKLTGRVTGRGQPVAGASVNARRGDEFVGWARTGSDGTFTMGSLPPGEVFEVGISHDAFRGLTRAGVHASDRVQDFVLEPGAEVSGRVVDAKGAGVAGAQVQVQVNGKHAKSVATDATGAFTAGGLDEGRIALQVQESNQGFIPTDWIEVASGTRDARLVATPGESIAGVVRDRDGKPVQQVSVQALDAAGNDVASTWVWQEDGAFELRGLRPGAYTVRARRYEPAPDGAAGQALPSHEVAAVATGTKNLDLRVD